MSWDEYIPDDADWSGGNVGQANTPYDDSWTPSSAMSELGGGGGSHWSGLDNVGGGGQAYGESSPLDTAGSWLRNSYNSLLGPGSFLGGTQGAFPGQEKNGWLGPLMSMGSGIYGMSLAAQQRKMAQQAIRQSSPWFTSGGVNNAGAQLTNVINGNFAGDGGYDLAQQAAARASANQPGGFAASAAATAALRYQNERIGALSGPAGVGFNPASSYDTALRGMQGANDQASRSLGSIGYGGTGNNAGIPPWLTQYLIQNGLQRPT